MHVYFSTLLYCYEPGFQYFISPYLSYNSKRHNPKHSVKNQTVVKKQKTKKGREKCSEEDADRKANSDDDLPRIADAKRRRKEDFFSTIWPKINPDS